MDGLHPLPDARVRPTADGTPERRARVLHKRYLGRDLYVVANLDDSEAELELVVRGTADLEAWDPHRGVRRSLDAERRTVNRGTSNEPAAATVVTMVVPANEARVLVERP